MGRFHRVLIGWTVLLAAGCVQQQESSYPKGTGSPPGGYGGSIGGGGTTQKVAVIEPMGGAIPAGNRDTFSVVDPTGRPVTTGTPTWSTAGEVGFIAASGLFTATSPGIGSIVATLGGATEWIQVYVTAPRSVSFASDVYPIFSQNCSSCHSGVGSPYPTAPAWFSSNDAGTTMAHLVDQTSVGYPPAVTVAPFDTWDSVLVGKVEGTGRFSSQMPYLRSPLSDDDRQTIRDWITGGAAP